MGDTDLNKPGDEAPPGTTGTGKLCLARSGTGKLDGESCPERKGTGKVTTGLGAG